MKKKTIVFLSLIMVLALLAACGSNTKTALVSPEKEVIKVVEGASLPATNSALQGAKRVMKIHIAGKEYNVDLTNNITTQDIMKNMPLELNMIRYAKHEYYDRLPFTPVMAKETTPYLKAGHVYYWNGGNALVINYIDYDISPYQLVHIGEVRDSSIIDLLKNAEEKISVRVSVN